MLNIGVWFFIPIEEAKVALGSFPNVLIFATLFLSSSTLPPAYPDLSYPPPPALSPPHWCRPVLSPSLSPSLFSPAAPLRPVKYIPTCYQHRLGGCNPSPCCASRHRTIIGCLTIYCAAIFWNLEMNVSILSSPAACRAPSRGGYAQLISVCLYSCIPDSLLDNLFWKLPRMHPIRGVI